MRIKVIDILYCRFYAIEWPSDMAGTGVDKVRKPSYRYGKEF